MPSIIRATAINHEDGTAGSVMNAVRAAEKCITQCGINKHEINMLINVGIYREQNITEPSMASLVQQKLGLNPDPIASSPAGASTFSIDLMNGACGFMYAAQVADSFLSNNTISRVLIVSGDVHPSKKKRSDFPYTHFGAAAIIEKSKNEKTGFNKFMFKTSSDTYLGVEGYQDIYEHGIEGRNQISINVAGDYHEKLFAFAVDSAKEFIIDNSINVKNTALITTQPTQGFCGAIAHELKIEKELAVDIYGEYGDPHTSALLIAYNNALQQGIFSRVEKILFVGAGSGLTSACGLYFL